MLKSDQNGIEIEFEGGEWDAPLPLKSDQNGIEIAFGKVVVFDDSIVKIRPKWD